MYRHPREYYGPGGSSGAHAFEGLDFTGVSLRNFILRANQFQLQKFCDNYLNLDIPEGMAGFRPAGPFVLFQVINYGRMSPSTYNRGWVAQHEVLFGVPLEGYWHEDGELVEGMASVSPFIFVDNDWSVVTGREIYGWPKYPARIVPEVNPWIQDPREARRLLTLQTPLFQRLYSGEPLQNLVLMELVQRAPELLQVPLDMEYLLNPFLQLPKAMADSFALIPDALQGLAESWFGGGLGSPAGQAQQAFENMLRLPPETYFNTLNLKQFRSSDPGAAAYQALVNARMQVKRFGGAGLLGSGEMLRGDPTGGFTLLLHRYPEFPIIESLGLEVESESNAGGVTVAALKPLLPMWTSMDMRYDRGVRLCWRSRGAQWALGSAPAVATKNTPPPHFNTTLGPLLGATEGPFDFYDATIRLLPIRAKPPDPRENRKRREEWGLPVEDTEPEPNLQQKFDELLSRPVQDALEVLANALDQEGLEATHEVELLPWVFLVVKKFERMSSAANDLGWWGGRSVDFAMIAKVTVRGMDDPFKGLYSQESERPESFVFETYFVVVPQAFADTPLAVNAGREVLGLPTSYAGIIRGRDPWIESGVPRVDRNLLTVKVRDYSAVGVGQGSEVSTLFQVHRVVDQPPNRRRGSRRKEDRFELAQRAEPPSVVESSGLLPETVDAVRVLWENSYQHGTAVRHLTLKQFRDEEDPTLVCYRALMAQEQVVGSWSGGEGHGIEALDGKYEVRFEELPSWPLVDALGLEVDRWEVSPEGAPVAVCAVEKPFWLKADLRWNLPLALERQSVDGQWHPGEDSSNYLTWLFGGKAFEPGLREFEKQLAALSEEEQQSGLDAEIFGFFKERIADFEESLKEPIRSLVVIRGEKERRLKTLDDVVRDVLELHKKRTLAETQKKVNINTASKKELALLPSVGSAVAQRIIDLRQTKSEKKFEQTKDLLEVKGIGRLRFALMKPYLTLEGETTLSTKVSPAP